MKFCTKCGIEKPLLEFSKSKRSKDGHRSDCKKCVKVFYENDKDRILAHMKEYREANKKKVAAQRKMYREVNRKKISAQRKVCRKGNRVTILAQKKVYRKVKRKEIAAKQRDYRRTSIGKAVEMASTLKRKALKKGVVTQGFNPIEILERDGYICQLCGAKTRPDFNNVNHPLYPNLDHIIPLSRGGAHTKLNTQCLCHQCNSEKSNTGKGDQLRMFG